MFTIIRLIWNTAGLVAVLMNTECDMVFQSSIWEFIKVSGSAEMKDYGFKAIRSKSSGQPSQRYRSHPSPPVPGGQETIKFSPHHINKPPSEGQYSKAQIQLGHEERKQRELKKINGLKWSWNGSERYLAHSRSGCLSCDTSFWSGVILR